MYSAYISRCLMLRIACKLIEGRDQISLNMFLAIPLPVFVLCMKHTFVCLFIYLFERERSQAGSRG